MHVAVHLLNDLVFGHLMRGRHYDVSPFHAKFGYANKWRPFKFKNIVEDK
jgi:hypothetical protein